MPNPHELRERSETEIEREECSERKNEKKNDCSQLKLEIKRELELKR